MENVLVKVEELADSLKEYANVRIDMVRFEAAEKTSKVVSDLSARIAVAVIALLFLFFFGMALGYALADLTGRTWLGFLIVAAFYFVICLWIWLAREHVFRLPVMNSMIKHLSGDEKDS